MKDVALRGRPIDRSHIVLTSRQWLGSYSRRHNSISVLTMKTSRQCHCKRGEPDTGRDDLIKTEVDHAEIGLEW